MIKQCKKCGSKNLYLEPRIKGQDVMSADMVALKCKDCGVWLKWCPKDERKYYIHKYPKDKWQKLKEWLKKEQGYTSIYEEQRRVALEEILEQMQELEGEKDVKD